MVKLKNKLIIFIVALGLFLRLYHLPSSITFAWDQERDAFTVKQLLVDKKPILIGPRVVNDQGFMLGPYFFYLLVPFYLVTNLHPYATILFVAFYSLVFLLASFFILKKLFSQKIALIFTFIWSVLPLAISVDTISWNPLLVPFLFIFLFYLLKTLDFSKIKNWLILGFYLGFSLNIHIQLVIFLFITFVFFLFNYQKYFLKNLFFLILGFLSSFLPLLIFDLRHQFLNLHLFLNFFQNSASVKNPFAFIPVWTNYINAIFSIKYTLFSILFWVFLSFTLFFLSKSNKINRVLFFTWIFFPIIFIVYSKRPSEYYFNFCLPIIVLAFSQLIAKLKINFNLILLVGIFLSFFSIFLKLQKKTIQSFSLANKIQVVKYISQKVNHQKFNLSYDVPFGQNSGYSYLLDYFNNTPTNNPNDSLIQIIIPAKLNYPSFGDISLKIPASFSQ